MKYYFNFTQVRTLEAIYIAYFKFRDLLTRKQANLFERIMWGEA